MTPKLRDWLVPAYVQERISPRKDARRWHLCELTPEQLADLCDRYRAMVFEKAGKDDPGRQE